MCNLTGYYHFRIAIKLKLLILQEFIFSHCFKINILKCCSLHLLLLLRICSHVIEFSGALYFLQNVINYTQYKKYMKYKVVRYRQIYSHKFCWLLTSKKQVMCRLFDRYSPTDLIYITLTALHTYSYDPPHRQNQE